MNKEGKALLDAITIEQEELSRKFNETDFEMELATIRQEASPILDKIRRFPTLPSRQALSLIMLHSFPGKLLHKDHIARVGSRYLNEPQTDWQVRHLSTQEGFHIIGRGELVPDINLSCPSGCHMLVTLKGLSPKDVATKRTDLLNEDDWDKLKTSMDNRCWHCGSKEGNECYRDGVVTILQRGHINPNLPLDVGNMLPLCDYCNRQYRDKFVLLPNGAIDRVNYESQIIAKKAIEKIVRIHGLSEVSNWISAYESSLTSSYLDDDDPVNVD